MIKADIVDTADHEDVGPERAHGRELIEAGEDIAAAFGLRRSRSG
jgi:hypothetical protein